MNYEDKLILGYKEALTQLRQHPTIIWTRNNFFLLIQSGLLAFELKMENNSDVKTSVMTCIAGLFIAIVWLWVNLAGQKLQRQWRAIVKEFEEKLFDKEDGENSVAGPFHRTREGVSKFLSITLALITLSSGFIVLWIVLVLKKVLIGV